LRQFGLGKRKESTRFPYSRRRNIIIKISGNKYLQYGTCDYCLVTIRKIELRKQFDIVAIVRGGGLTGQASAIQLGVARLLCKIDKENRLV
jgi:small subunit ribosomal protein S9